MISSYKKCLKCGAKISYNKSYYESRRKTKSVFKAGSWIKKEKLIYEPDFIAKDYNYIETEIFYNKNHVRKVNYMYKNTFYADNYSYCRGCIADGIEIYAAPNSIYKGNTYFDGKRFRDSKSMRDKRR